MFSGSLVAIITPMRPDGAVDFEAWARLLEFHLGNGTNGVVVGGTTGESATLREGELRELTQRACAQLRGRVAVIAGAGTSSTADTVERVGWLSALPIDGLLLVTPAYNRPTQEGLYLHFAAAAAAARKDRKSTRLNSSHSQISYAVFCLKKKKNITHIITGR